MNNYNLKSLIKQAVVLTGVATFAASALAGAARCGDIRSITRNGSFTNDCSAALTLDEGVTQARASAEQDATQHSLDRLAKFDGECTALGGAITEQGREATSNGVSNGGTPVVTTTDGQAKGNAQSNDGQASSQQNGQQQTGGKDTVVPATCSANATATVTHNCVCVAAQDSQQQKK